MISTSRLSEQHQVIAAMEAEFRTTLANENSRYQEVCLTEPHPLMINHTPYQLDRLYKSLQEELQASHNTAVMATQREQKSTCVVADLTAVSDHMIGHVISCDLIRW